MRLDTELNILREKAGEYAADLRARALSVDARPDDLDKHLDSTALRAIRRFDPISLGCLKSAVVMVELAKGDAGTVLACPGQSLAGILTGLIGDEDQRGRLATAVADGRSWAFLAVTEPTGGSDVPRLRTELRRDGDGYRLHGAKRFVGNGSRGKTGVVLARTGPNPLSLRAALIEAPAPGLSAAPLDMIGLRGARISEMTFDGVPVRSADLLGSHLKSLRRGMWGVLQCFNVLRVQVAAMAVGTALAVHEYVRAERREWTVGEVSELDALAAEIESVRLLTFQAAADVDVDRTRGYSAALAKLTAVALCERVCARLPRLLGRGALLEHPLLEKWWRDSAAFEFMEGTSHIQRLHVTQGYLKGESEHAR